MTASIKKKSKGEEFVEGIAAQLVVTFTSDKVVSLKIWVYHTLENTTNYISVIKMWRLRICSVTELQMSFKNVSLFYDISEGTGFKWNAVIERRYISCGISSKPG